MGRRLLPATYVRYLIDKFWINHTGVEAAVMEDPPSATDGAPVIAEDLSAAADEPGFSTNTGKQSCVSVCLPKEGASRERNLALGGCIQRIWCGPSFADLPLTDSKKYHTLLSVVGSICMLIVLGTEPWDDAGETGMGRRFSVMCVVLCA